MAVFDPDLLNDLTRSAIGGIGFRNQTPGFDPRSGEGARRAGGRFNPPRSLPVIYLCTSRPCVLAELTAQADRQSLSIVDLLPRELWSLSFSLDQILDLTAPEVLDTIGISPEDLVMPDRSLTRQIGEAAHERGHQGIRSFSATRVDEVVALFPENLGAVVVGVDLLETWEQPDQIR